MNSLKRNAVDFLCTFLLFTIILMSIALVADKSFSDGVLIVDEEKGRIEIFGTGFELREDILEVFDKLLKFNDNIFGRGFSIFLKRMAEFVFSYAGDFFKIAFTAAETAVGAR